MEPSLEKTAAVRVDDELGLGATTGRASPPAHWGALIGLRHTSPQFSRPRHKKLENVRAVALAVAHNQLSSQDLACKRPTDNRPRAVAEAYSDQESTLRFNMCQASGRSSPCRCWTTSEPHPRVVPEARFDNRWVDLAAEGCDTSVAASPWTMASWRGRAPVRIVAVASPRYADGRIVSDGSEDLAGFDDIQPRSTPQGRLRRWALCARGAALKRRFRSIHCSS